MSSVQALIADYVENAKKHGEATLGGDSKVANSSYDKMRFSGDSVDTVSLSCAFCYLTSKINNLVKLVI